MKNCRKCNEEKEEHDFYFSKRSNSYETICKKCRQKSVKKYLDENDNLKRIFYTRVQTIKRKVNYEIDKDFRDYLIDLWHQQNGKCHYTGVSMVFKGYTKNVKNVMTLDRIDSNLGYVKGNVVLCCSIINKIKQNLSIKELLEWIELIRINTGR